MRGAPLDGIWRRRAKFTLRPAASNASWIHVAAARVAHDRDDVEADGPRRDGCAASQRRAARTTRRRLRTRHGLGGSAERRVAPAALHFDEDDGPGILGDDVQLAVLVPDISIQDSERIFFE